VQTGSRSRRPLDLLEACPGLHELHVELVKMHEVSTRTAPHGWGVPETDALAAMTDLRALRLRFGEIDMRALERPISRMTHLETLDLSGNYLDVGQIDPLLSTLSKLPTLRSLSLMYCCNVMKESSQKAFATLLAELAGDHKACTAKLTHLNLGRNPIVGRFQMMGGVADDLQRQLADVLGAAVKLTSLDLFHIRFCGWEAAPISEILVSSIGRVESLRHLNLGGNSIGFFFDFSIMCSNLRALTDLTHLDVSINEEPTAEACKCLVDFALAMPALQILDVTRTLNAGGPNLKYAVDALEGRVTVKSEM